MSSITAQQAKLDLELVPKEKRLEIGKCNRRLNPCKTQREPMFQVVMDAHALTLCYYAFLSTSDVPEVYMHQFWDSIHKHETSYKFRMDRKKKFSLNLETFRDIFQICPRLGHTREIKSMTDVVVEQMHQPWRTFATIINRSLSGKTTGLDKLRLSRVQILWGMYYKKNADYVELLWEDFTYQIENRFSRRNKIGMHTSRDDYLINTSRFVSANKESQNYGARLLESMTSPKIRETKAYKTYLGYATGVTPSKKARKIKKLASPNHNYTLGVSASKKKAQAKADRGKDIELLSDAALLEDAQLKKALMKSRQETHNLQASGSSEGADFESEVPNESKAKSSDTRDSYDDNESHDNDDEGSENDDDSGNDAQDSKRTNSNEEANPNLNLNVDEEEETQEEEYVHTTNYSVPTNEETDDENKEFNDEEYDDLYKDVNVRSKVSEHEEVRKGDVEMHDATRESGSKQSSSVSSNFSSKILILDNVSPVIDEVASMMNVKSYTAEFKKKAQEEKDRYIDLVEKSIKDIIKDEVKSQLPQILPKEVSDFSTPVI
ncbi:hypothetical protein Tco_0450818 [Tanacetum coccineum]